MLQILYAIRFKGNATPEQGRSDTLIAKTSGDSCSMTTRIRGKEVAFNIQPLTDEHAYFESRVKVKGAGKFHEEGRIQFGENGPVLYFTTEGEGYLGLSPDPTIQNGSVVWRVIGGEGQFEGVGGYITSNFIIESGGDITDYQVGILFVPGPPEE